MIKNKRLVHGDDLLYGFLNDLLERDSERYSEIPSLLLREMGVWLPLDIYYRIPVLLPWVVRDPTCRGNRKAGIPDSWSSPDERGFLRDDNSLIKSIPRALEMRGPRARPVDGRRMGSEFVAAHVWRRVHAEMLATRHPLLNSFVPNLVWLPSQIAKLTDREGGLVQRALQGLSQQIYRDAPVDPRLQGVVREAWDMLPPIPDCPEPLDHNSLNWFVTTPRFVRTREDRLRSVIAALEALASAKALPKKVSTTRYKDGLPAISEGARAALLTHLQRFDIGDEA